MNPIAILPNLGDEEVSGFSAVNLESKATGRTAGEALDALTSQSRAGSSATSVIVQHLRPDQFFSEAQRHRLTELMARWRTAREMKTSLSLEEQSELERLIDQEMLGSAERSTLIEREFEITRLSQLMIQLPNKDKNVTGKLDLASFTTGAALTLLIPACLMFYRGSITGGIAIVVAAVIGTGVGLFKWHKDSLRKKNSDKFTEQQ